MAAIVITEDAVSDFSVEGPVTLLLDAPAGFQFNTLSAPDVVASATADMTSVTGTAGITTSQITITYTVGAQATTDSITVGGVTPIQVQPTGTTTATGDITRNGGGSAAALPGITNATTSFGALASVVGTMTKLGVTTEPAGSTAGAVFGTQPVVKTQDQFGNLTTTGLGAALTVTASLTTGTGPLQGTAGLDIGTGAGNGIVTYTDLRLDVAEASKVLTFAATGPTSAVSASFATTHSTATQLILTTPPSASTVAGVAFAAQPVVTVQDAFGNTVVSDNTTSVTAARTGGTGTLSGTPSATASSGIATFSGLSLDLVGADKVLTFTGGGLTAAASGTFTITHAALSQLIVTTQPSASTAPTVAFVQQPIVTLQDAFGNTVTSDSTTVVTAAISGGTGVLAGITTSTASGGIADFAGKGLNISLSGTGKVLTFTAGGATDGLSGTFAISAGAADVGTSTIVASPTSIVADGAATSTITVQLKDISGTNLTTGGDTVVIATDLGSVGGVTDNGDGTYTATVTAGTTTGTATVSGTLNGPAITATATITFTAEAAAVTPDPAPKATDGGVTVTLENTETTTTSTTVEVALSTTSSSGSGATVTVPAGALPAGTTLEVSAVTNLASLVTQARPPSTVDVTLAFSIKATSGGDAVTSGFAEPVGLSFTVDASTVPAGATGDQLRLAFWNGVRWVLVDGTVTINADGTATVSGTTDHFTLFAVMYNPVGFGVAFEGELPNTGVGIVTFGGTTDQLEAALINQSCISPIFVTDKGAWVALVPTAGVPAVNAAFRALFADGIPLGTPMLATGCND